MNSDDAPILYVWPGHDVWVHRILSPVLICEIEPYFSMDQAEEELGSKAFFALRLPAEPDPVSNYPMSDIPRDRYSLISVLFPNRNLHDMSGPHQSFPEIRTAGVSTESMLLLHEYWLTFLEDMLFGVSALDSRDLVEDFKLPFFIPDDFESRLHDLDGKERYLETLFDRQYSGENVGRQIRSTWKGMLDHWFQNHFEPGFFISRDSIEYLEDEGLWSVTRFATSSDSTSASAVTLKDMWMDLKKNVRSSDLRSIFPESRRSEWESSHLLYGEICYDISVFWALDVFSPLLLPVSSFRRWVATAERICSNDL